MSGIRKITEFILFSNLFIALGAAFLCAANQLILLGEVQQPLLVLFAFCATFLSYLYHRFNMMEKRETNKDNEVIAWSKKNKLYLRMFFPLLALPLLYLFFQFTIASQIIIALMGLISFAYSRPIFGKPLRELPYAKIFLISFNWAACTGALILSETGTIQSSEAWFCVTSSFLFIFLLTIPFDIRDLEYDRKGTLPTIPVRLGIQHSKILATVLLTIWLGINIVLTRSQHSFTSLLGISILSVVLLSVLWNTTARSSEKYFLGVVDGMIVLWGVLVFGIYAFG